MGKEKFLDLYKISDILLPFNLIYLNHAHELVARYGYCSQLCV